MFNKDIAEKALIANLAIGVWSARKTDKAVLKEISELYKSEEEQGSFSKLLIAKNRLEAIKEAASGARKLHNDLTLPWVDGGGRLLPSKDFPEYSKRMQEYKDLFFEAVDTFVDLYDKAKEEGVEKLGQIANEKDYPSKEAVREKYNFEYTFFPVPDNGDFRVTLSPDFVDSLKHNFDSNQEERFKKAKKAVVDEVIGLVSNAIIRLRNTDKAAWFKSSTIEHIINYRKEHAMIELLDDEPLFNFITELSNLASMYSVQDLRGDDQLRVNVSDAFLNILKNAAKDPTFITEPVDILLENQNININVSDINPDLDQVVSNMTDIIPDLNQPQPDFQTNDDDIEEILEPNGDHIESQINMTNKIMADLNALDEMPLCNGDLTSLTKPATVIDPENFTGIPEGADVEIMNAFGLKLGEQPEVETRQETVQEIKNIETELSWPHIDRRKSFPMADNAEIEAYENNHINNEFVPDANFDLEKEIAESFDQPVMPDQDSDQEFSLEKTLDKIAERQELTMKEIAEQQSKHYEKIHNVNQESKNISDQEYQQELEYESRVS